MDPCVVTICHCSQPTIGFMVCNDRVSRLRMLAKHSFTTGTGLGHAEQAANPESGSAEFESSFFPARGVLPSDLPSHAQLLTSSSTSSRSHPVSSLCFDCRHSGAACSDSVLWRGISMDELIDFAQTPALRRSWNTSWVRTPWTVRNAPDSLSRLDNWLKVMSYPRQKTCLNLREGLEDVDVETLPRGHHSSTTGNKGSFVESNFVQVLKLSEIC